MLPLELEPPEVQWTELKPKQGEEESEGEGRSLVLAVEGSKDRHGRLPRASKSSESRDIPYQTLESLYD